MATTVTNLGEKYILKYPGSLQTKLLINYRMQALDGQTMKRIFEAN